MGGDSRPGGPGGGVFRKLLAEGEAGADAGLLRRGIDKTEVWRGVVLAITNIIKPQMAVESEG